MPSVAHADSGHCPSDNLSRRVGFHTKNQWIFSKLKTILCSWVLMSIHLPVSRVYILLSEWSFLYLLLVYRIATRAKNGAITRIPGTTIGAGPFFQKTAILHVTTNAIRVLESGLIYFCHPVFSFADGTERQIIKDADGNMFRPKIRACNIFDLFVNIIREDDSTGLFINETEREGSGGRLCPRWVTRCACLSLPCLWDDKHVH